MDIFRSLFFFLDVFHDIIERLIALDIIAVAFQLIASLTTMTNHITISSVWSFLDLAITFAQIADMKIQFILCSFIFRRSWSLCFVFFHQIFLFLFILCFFLNCSFLLFWYIFLFFLSRILPRFKFYLIHLLSQLLNLIIFCMQYLFQLFISSLHL